MRCIRLAGIGFCALWCLLSCGLAAFYYIDYIPEAEYADTRTVVRLPSSSAEGYSSYFDNFIIFYRIYISGGTQTGTGPHLQTSATDRNDINTALNSDYQGLNPLTDLTSTTVSTANLENNFFNRKYFQITLEGADIAHVLGSGSLGETLVVAFPPNPGQNPTLTLNGTDYILQRAVEGQQRIFTPKPNRQFLNHPDLYNNANATDIDNADVAVNTRAEPRYTYISLYIAAKGRSLELPPKAIFSQPTFIGIFRLADSS
jgi:hypothetical protein